MKKKVYNPELAAKKAALRDIKKSQSVVFCVYTTDEVVAPITVNNHLKL